MRPISDKLPLHFEKELWGAGIPFTMRDGSIYLIRRMDRKDIGKIVLLEQQIFIDPWSAYSFETELAYGENCIALVGLTDHIIVAYSLSLMIFDELHIHNIGVDLSHRRKGYAELMLKMILEIAALKHVRTIHLEVRRSNEAAISLYSKYGFEIVGIRKNYYQRQNEDAILMTKPDLSTVEM